MNAGFVALWIWIVLVILMWSGWKEEIAPDIKPMTLALLSGSVLVLLAFPLWWTLPFDYASIKLQIAIFPLLVAATYWLFYRNSIGGLLYLVSCVLLLAFIWWSIRKIYSIDPVFFLLDPRWDAPIVCGAVTAILASRPRTQLAVIIWTAVLAEALLAYQQGRNYTVWIGSSVWWDSFMVAIAASRAVSLLIHGLRAITARLGLLQ